MKILPSFFVSLSLLSSCLLAFSSYAAEEKPKRIEDNSFLIEEAYNQETGVVQYIQSYQYSNKTKEWLYTFTHEMPFPNQTHQLSYAVPITRVRGDSSNTDFGDIAVNYRYQLIRNDALALAPRISVILPTGDYKKGLGNGAVGYQVNIPLSVDLADKWVSHWNAGATYTPNARGVTGAKADSRGYNYGASVVYLQSENLNFLVEFVRNSAQSVQPDGSKSWDKSSFINPGFRYAKDYQSGLQVVSGVSFPIGVGPSKKDNGIFLYLSFEK